MALSDTKIRTLAPRNRPWQLADHDGLVIEVLPTGRKIWRFRYRFDNKSQKITLGEYPAFSLAEARLWREKCRSMVAHGINSAQKKQEEKLKQKDPTTVKTFAKRWLTDIVEKSNRDPRNITRIIEKDIIPIIGKLELEELTTAHIQVVLDCIKQRGSDHVALLTRNVLKRMLAYAISRGIIFNNPAAAIEARYIAQATSRDVALTAEEIGILLRGIRIASGWMIWRGAAHGSAISAAQVTDWIWFPASSVAHWLRPPEWCRTWILYRWFRQPGKNHRL